ncbi:Trm112 family protein [Pelovirga terrestris]|uniref:Trm112 family protein n=1 Tax=Pelovirga terrestris TaxID=2771352 RepID=UPI003B587D25
MTISSNLLKILVCPVCKDKPIHIESEDFLVCSICGLKYAVINDIPVMFVEDENISAS